MGTCVSKCCSNPSPFNSSPPQDKLVISQSLSTPTNPLSIDLSKVLTTSSASSSSSSSSLSSSSSSSSSTSSSCSNTSNSTYSQSSLKDRSFSNEFLLSCAKENPHVIILDPHKHSVTKPKSNKYPVKTSSPPPSKLVQGPKKQYIASAKQSLPSKRERSSSPPTLANRKSMKTELSSPIPPPSRKFSSPSTHWRSTNATIFERQRHEVRMSGNALPFHPAARKEKLLPSSPYNFSSRLISSAEKNRETYVNHIRHTNCEVGEHGSREVFSEHSSRIPLMEDINNPLISLDCFIFI